MSDRAWHPDTPPAPCCGDAADCQRPCERKTALVPTPKPKRPYVLTDADRRFLRSLRIRQE